MSRGQGAGDRLPVYAAWVAVVGTVGLGSAFFAPGNANRLGALIGVAFSLLGGLMALSLKRWALERSLQFALGMVGASFGIRLVLMGAGVAVTLAKGAASSAFVIGFFGVYFPLQWIEIGYILAESKRRGRGGR